MGWRIGCGSRDEYGGDSATPQQQESDRPDGGRHRDQKWTGTRRYPWHIDRVATSAATFDIPEPIALAKTARYAAPN
jgi:hypothetical protein